MQNEIMKRNVEKRRSEPRQNLVYRVDRCSVVLLWPKKSHKQQNRFIFIHIYRLREYYGASDPPLRCTNPQHFPAVPQAAGIKKIKSKKGRYLL